METSAPKGRAVGSPSWKQGPCVGPTAPLWTRRRPLEPEGGLSPSDVGGENRSLRERPRPRPTTGLQRGRRRKSGGPCCPPALPGGKPGTFWKAWPPCPVGFSEDNTDSLGQPSCCGHVPISACWGTAGGLAGTPPGAVGPPPPREPQPQTIHPTENRWPFFLRSPWTASPGSALHRSREAGTPAPQSETHQRLRPGRKSVRLPLPPFLPEAQLLPPKCSCLLRRPSATPFPTGQGRLAAGRVGVVVSAWHCGHRVPPVTRLAPSTVASNPRSPRLPSGLARGPLTCWVLPSQLLPRGFSLLTAPRPGRLPVTPGASPEPGRVPQGEGLSPSIHACPGVSSGPLPPFCILGLDAGPRTPPARPSGVADGFLTPAFPSPPGMLCRVSAKFMATQNLRK